ncbi:7 transmembrane receptor [Aphelenchoides bicaudatus]|nr:7 transmembrane receptor [Aphelenchoides bicaudatus]
MFRFLEEMITLFQLAERPVCTRLDILKRHLNYSDLIVLFIYVPSRGAWLLTYDWRGGDFLCRLVKFLHTFAFQISSNIIVVIAVDRLLTVMSTAHHRPERAHKRTKIMLLAAWITAFLISLPQFAVWRTYNAFKNWAQCMSVWEIIRAEAVLKNNTRINANELMREENIYVVLHILAIFWIPALVIMLSYIIVSCWVYWNSAPQLLVNGSSRGSGCDGRGTSYLTGAETMDTMVNRSTGVQFAMNPKIVINDDVVRPLTTTRSSDTSVDILRHNSTNKVIASAMRRSHSTFSAKVNRSRAIRVSFLLIFAYIVCWLPYNFLSLIQFIDSEIFSKHANKMYCLHGMMVFNSVVNPYLYGLFGKMCRTKRRNG